MPVSVNPYGGGNANPGGRGGRRQVIRPVGPPPKKRGCCPTVAAVRSVKRGNFRLARRYAAMSVRLIAGKVA